MSNLTVGKTYGTVSEDRRKEMTGLDFVRGLADGSLPMNTLARTLGYDVSEAENGRVVVTLEPTDAHLNPAGTVHGGLSATLLDSCMGLAIQSTLEKGVGQTTLEFKISLTRAITPQTGIIRAEGKVLSRGRQIGTAEGRLTDGGGKLLAHGTTTCLIFRSSERRSAASSRQKPPVTPICRNDATVGTERTRLQALTLAIAPSPDSIGPWWSNEPLARRSSRQNRRSRRSTLTRSSDGSGGWHGRSGSADWSRAFSAHRA